MIAFLRRLWQFVRPYQTRLVLGLVFGMLFALTNGALLGVVKAVVNLVFGEGQDASASDWLGELPGWLRPAGERFVSWGSSGGGSPSRTAAVLAISSIPLVMFFRSLFHYLNVYLVNWASAHAVADLRTRTFAHLQSLPLSFFSTANTGDLISRVTSDTQALRLIMGTAVSSLLRDPVTIVFLAAMLLATQPWLTLICMVVLPVCVVPITVYGRKVRKSARAMQNHAAEVSTLMHESFTGNRIVKAYNLEDTVLAQFREATKKFVNQAMRVVRANEIPSSVLEFLSGVGIALVLFYIYSRGEKSPGDLSAFVVGIYMMYQPIKSLTRIHNQLHQAQAASQRVFELLDTRSTIVEPASPVPVDAAGKDIRFENVRFRYGDRVVLDGIDLTVKAGQMVALVGSSGSGKTTLANLLLRFYDPQEGAVLIGSTDIRQVAIRDLRRQVALVTQETILFHDTIRRNIALGRPGATDAEIEAAARAANAHAFIMDSPNGYDSMVGEKGVNVSGGQRQRIAIARAILKNAPILVLDEATSALDSESERVVQAELEKLMEGRTTICIAHRLSTVQKADRIVVLDQGGIVETGTHAELLDRKGVYYRLHNLHFRDE